MAERIIDEDLYAGAVGILNSGEVIEKNGYKYTLVTCTEQKQLGRIIDQFEDNGWVFCKAVSKVENGINIIEAVFGKKI